MQKNSNCAQYRLKVKLKCEVEKYTGTKNDKLNEFNMKWKLHPVTMVRGTLKKWPIFVVLQIKAIVRQSDQKLACFGAELREKVRNQYR